MNIKKDDKVVVITGKFTGKIGKVLSVDTEKSSVIVEGVNLAKKHQKPRSQQEQGGIIEKANGIHVSDVMLICPKCNQATRVATYVDENGNKFRKCKKEKCGAVIDEVTGEKKKGAAK